jgi:hypothetical protein
MVVLTTNHLISVRLEPPAADISPGRRASVAKEEVWKPEVHCNLRIGKAGGGRQQTVERFLPAPEKPGLPLKMEVLRPRLHWFAFIFYVAPGAKMTGGPGTPAGRTREVESPPRYFRKPGASHPSANCGPPRSSSSWSHLIGRFGCDLRFGSALLNPSVGGT